MMKFALAAAASLFCTTMAFAEAPCTGFLQYLSCDYFGPNYGAKFALCKTADGYAVHDGVKAHPLATQSETPLELILEGDVVVDGQQGTYRFSLERYHDQMSFYGRFYDGTRGLTAECGAE